MSAGPALDGLLETLSRCFDAESAQRLLAMQVGEHFQERIDHLAQAANEGTLDESERNEYDALISAADFISILKLKALSQIRDAKI